MKDLVCLLQLHYLISFYLYKCYLINIIAFEVVIVFLDFLISDTPDSTLLMRMMGIELVIIIIVIMQYAYIFFILYIFNYLLKTVVLLIDGNLSTESGSKNLQKYLFYYDYIILIDVIVKHQLHQRQ